MASWKRRSDSRSLLKSCKRYEYQSSVFIVIVVSISLLAPTLFKSVFQAPITSYQISSTSFISNLSIYRQSQSTSPCTSHQAPPSSSPSSLSSPALGQHQPQTPKPSSPQTNHIPPNPSPTLQPTPNNFPGPSPSPKTSSPPNPTPQTTYPNSTHIKQSACINTNRSRTRGPNICEWKCPKTIRD